MAAMDPGSQFDADVAARANDPYSQYSSNPTLLAQQRQAFIQSQNPQQIAQQQQRNQETNAYQTARDGALGMMMPGSMGADGVDYGKAQGDPSAALNQFLGSGYTGQQALQDGWGKGVGTPGWQSTPQSQQLNPNGGNMAAMAPGAPGWGQQAGQGIYQQLGAQLGPQGPAGGGMPPGYQQPRPPSPQGGQGGNPFASLAGPMPSSMQHGQQQGGNPFGALSSYLDQRSQGGYNTQRPQAPPPPAQAPLQAYGNPTPTSPLQATHNSSILNSLANQLRPVQPYKLPSLSAAPPAQQTTNPSILAALAQQLGRAPATGPATESRYGVGHF